MNQLATFPQTITSAEALSNLSNVPTTVKLVGRALLSAKFGSIQFTFPDGRQVAFAADQEGPNADLSIHDFAFARKGLAGGDVGFAEAYMDGDWSTTDLTAVLEYFSANFDALGGGGLARGQALVRWVNKLRHVFNRNSKKGAKRNILAHYDLGNDFYEAWLDQSMTYSSALYTSPNLSLSEAQSEKYEAICRAMAIKPGDHVLEIGCGWGGFAEHAALNHDARVTCLTISDAQATYARDRMKRLGLADKVEIRIEDYRDHKGAYDGIASIEMFEAVGESYWPSYFSQIKALLKPGAKAALQIITIDNDLFESYRKRADFIQRYIFPGGMLPSERALRNRLKDHDLTLEDAHYFGLDYAKTLALWKRAFGREWP
ncbi:MAG: cyclopropane-fatty-acyl-phospholipid synthase family protein, partial [Pseudomonadota bacterium]